MSAGGGQGGEIVPIEPEWKQRLGVIADDLWQRGDKATSSALHEVRSLIDDALNRPGQTP